MDAVDDGANLERAIRDLLEQKDTLPLDVQLELPQLLRIAVAVICMEDDPETAAAWLRCLYAA